MKNDDQDKELRHLFQGMRIEDLKSVPAFEDLLSESSARNKVGHAAAFYLAWAASVMIIIFLATFLFHTAWNSSPAPIEDLDKWASLSSWDASTDAMLTMPESEVDDIFSTATDTWLEKSDIAETTD